MLLRRSSLLLAVLFAGCSFSEPPPDPGSGSLVWVAKSYVGGQQCTTGRFDPPGPEEELEASGVAVYTAAVVPQVVCTACVVCPSYAAVHYAQIRTSNVAHAETLGFERTEAPAED